MADAWAFPSSKGTTTYEVVRQSDGSLTCNCPGWTFKRKDAVRECKHTKIVAGANPGTFSRVGSTEPKEIPRRGLPTDMDRAMGGGNTPAATPAVISRGRKFTAD